jgi:hypothetical protein
MVPEKEGNSAAKRATAQERTSYVSIAKARSSCQIAGESQLNHCTRSCIVCNESGYAQWRRYLGGQDVESLVATSAYDDGLESPIAAALQRRTKLNAGRRR